MEATTNNGTEENNVETVRAYTPSVCTTLTLGDIQITRRFMAVDDERNTDPTTQPIETIRFSHRAKIGGDYWLVDGTLSNRYGSVISDAIYVGVEASDIVLNTESKKLITVPEPFRMDQNRLFVTITWGCINSLYRYENVDESMTVGPKSLAKLLNIKASTAEKLMSIVNQVREYSNCYVGTDDE